jgi:hypothetical protein
MRTKRLTITELEQIRQRAEAATGGNWQISKRDYYDHKRAELVTNGHVYLAKVFTGEPDALFISEARQDVPDLVAEVETLITEKAAARRMLDELIGEMANAAEAGYALAPETVRSDLEKIRKELIDHGE